MSLFPFVTTEDLTLTDQEVTASSIREYEIDFEKGTLTGRIVTGVDALCVWAYLALKAKRYRWIIYSWGYAICCETSGSFCETICCAAGLI